jgi:hypothetical protein
MSTKNLARTVIEGGRSRVCGFLRRETNAAERSFVRQRLRQLTADADRDDVLLPSKDTGGFRCFRDKLGPAKRWLGSQVGRPWDLVRSELFARFDTRTTPGRHILFDHILDEVKEDGSRGYWRFSVDRHGILRRAPYKRKGLRPPGRYFPGQTRVERALAGRRIGERGALLFWFLPTPYGGYRQHHRLHEADAKFWRSMPEWFRKEHEPSAVHDDDSSKRN